MHPDRSPAIRCTLLLACALASAPVMAVVSTATELDVKEAAQNIDDALLANDVTHNVPQQFLHDRPYQALLKAHAGVPMDFTREIETPGDDALRVWREGKGWQAQYLVRAHEQASGQTCAVEYIVAVTFASDSVPVRASNIKMHRTILSDDGARAATSTWTCE